MGLAGAALAPTPPRAPAQQPPWSSRAPIPVTKHAAPSWHRAGRGEVGDLCSGDTAKRFQPQPQQGHPWKDAGSGRGRRQVALGALTLFSLFSIPDLPPAQLISALHRSGMETAPAPGEVCSPCVYT